MKKMLVLVAILVGLAFASISNAVITDVLVPSNPLWTDTQLTVTTGQQVNVTASGLWNWGNDVPSFGPDGDPVFTDASDMFYSPSLHGELIAYIGDDPYQGHWHTPFFPQSTGYWNIGSSAQFTSDHSGKLWLGFNDGAVFLNGETDNTGSVTAHVNVIPEPSAWALAILGLLLLGAHRLRVG